MRRACIIVAMAVGLMAVGCAHDRKFIVVKAPEGMGFDTEFFATTAAVPSSGWFITGEVFKGSGNSVMFIDYTTGSTYGTEITTPATYSATKPTQMHVIGGGFDYHVMLVPEPGFTATMQLTSPSSPATFGGNYNFVYIHGNWPTTTTTHTTIAASGCSILVLGRVNPVTTTTFDQVFLLRQSTAGGGVSISKNGVPGSYLLSTIRHYVEVITTTPVADFPIQNLPALDQERFSKSEGLALLTRTGP
ncbi:MAG: hypothetical protein JNG88_07225 [Phycisphaerales bacterium]|nr:hypothetical protein [Phycisphaerales bacterium]